VKAAQEDPLLNEKLAVRRWDDLAKDPELQTPPLDSYEQMAVNSLVQSRSVIVLHGRTYRVPAKAAVVVCVDGFDPEYLERGIKDGIIPNLAKIKHSGFHATAKCAMPSLTNPNNVSIITGSPVSAHGIVGNYILDRETGKEVMIQDDTLLRGSTILEQMSKLGVRVAAITAKDKLRAILGHGLHDAICFSAQYAASSKLGPGSIGTVEDWLGQKQPPQYSGELSLFVMDAGVRALEEDRADLFYLTLSDYIQHKYAPGTKESNNFLAALDQRIGRLMELGADVAVTGDHGMSDKSNADGTPNVLFLEDAINDKWGQGSARVIYPIADPFVIHHGALGGFVRVYLKRADDLEDVVAYCKTFPQVQFAMPSAEAAAKFEVDLEREGDIIVIASDTAAIGARKDEHDMSNLGEHRLRTHGGISEQATPLMLSRPAVGVDDGDSRQWRNFDIFDLILNH
jgi:phosphonoacetate hydrolase